MATLLRAPLTFIAAARSRVAQVQYWVGGAAMMPLFLLCALLTLWRGRSTAAWALSVLLLAALVINGLDAIPTSRIAFGATHRRA